MVWGVKGSEEIYELGLGYFLWEGVSRGARLPGPGRSCIPWYLKHRNFEVLGCFGLPKGSQ